MAYNPSDLSSRTSNGYVLRSNGIRPASPYYVSGSGLKHGVEEDSPAACRPAVDRMREAAELPDALMGGTRAMRQMADTFLPQQDGETHLQWSTRIGRSTCFPLYSDALKTLSSRPFSRRIQWTEEPPEQMAEFLRDVDGTGRTLENFAKDALELAMHRGMVHVLVDAMGGGETLEQVRSRKVTAAVIDPLHVLDIREEVDQFGRRHVVYVRYVTEMEIETEAYLPQSETVIVELEKGISTLGKPAEAGIRREHVYDSKSSKWKLREEDRYEPATDGGVPFLTLYTNQTAQYEAMPVLEDLAFVNLAHYQSRADHAHVLMVARLVTLVTTGFAEEDEIDPSNKGEEIKVGPLRRINSPNPDAKVSFAQPERSLEDSFNDMKQLMEEAQRLGAKHMSATSRNVTATAVSSDDAKQASNLTAWTIRLEGLLNDIVDAAALWLGVEVGMSVELNKDFSSAQSNPEVGVKALAAVRDILTPRQAVVEAQRYGLLSPSLDVDAYMDELSEFQQSEQALYDQLTGESRVEEPVDDEQPLGDESQEE